MVRMIIKAVPGERDECIEYLRRHLPQAEFCFDQKRDSLDTFARSLRQAGEDACLHFEEDIILTRNFEQKVNAAIAEHSQVLIQFFSMRKADLTIGSRWEPGSSFLMNQCFYLPAGMSAEMLEYYEQRSEWYYENHPGGPDIVVREFLKHRRERYWLHCPSLVDHRVMRSAIDPRRSSKRQSLTFEEPV